MTIEDVSRMLRQTMWPKESEEMEQQLMREQFIQDLWFIVRRLRDMKEQAGTYGVHNEICSVQSKLSGALGKLESQIDLSVSSTQYCPHCGEFVIDCACAAIAKDQARRPEEI